MKTKHLLFTVLGVAGFSLCAQAQPAAQGWLDANNIRSSLSVKNTMWYDSVSGNAQCEYPKGSGKHAGYAASLWITGKTPGDTIITAANTYRSGGKSDFWPGVLNTNGTISATDVGLWNRIWKVRRGTIDSFRSIVLQVGTSNPAALQNALTAANFDDLKAWPAKGSASAQGAGGQSIASLSTTGRDYAPFVDVDGDGSYNYLMGDYPKIKGEEMLWMAFNDMGNVKTQTGSLGRNLEIHLSAYAYVRNTVADNIQFYEYKIHNRSNTPYDSVRTAVWTDVDLGFAYNDFIGFDSAHRMGYAYNATAVDGNGTGSTYGANPPISGIILLQTFGDNGANPAPTGAFTYFSNGPAVPTCRQDPSSAQDFYNLVAGYDRCGNPFINPVSNQSSKTVFPDPPTQSGGWSECALNNDPGDRRFILSSSPGSLPAGASQTVAFALAVSPNGGGCPSVNHTGIQATADTAWQIYYNPVYPTGVKNTNLLSGIALQPNPVRDQLLLTGLSGSTNTTVRVMDLSGKTLYLPTQRNGNSMILQVSGLASGIYAIQIQEGDQQQVLRFVKE